MFFSGGERVALASLKERKEKKKQVAPADNLINNVFSVLSLETAFCFTLFTPSCVSLSIYMCTARLGAAASSPHQKIHHRRGFAVPSAIASSFGVREAMSRPVSGSAVWASSAATLR